MPHLVSSFLRHSTSSFEAQVTSFKKATGRWPSPTPASSSTTTSHRQRHNAQRRSQASEASDDIPLDDHADDPAMRTMTSLQRRSLSTERHGSQSAHGEHHHRLSFGALHFGRSSRESHGNPNLVLGWKIESPPILLHGNAENSTGALVSGLLFLTVKEDPVQIESFTATLNIHVSQKRPYMAHCHDCINQYTELQKWAFLQGPVTLTKGQHGFPFSVLLKGDLPASMDNQQSSILYEFCAEVVPVAGTGSAVKFEKILDVKRSLPSPELPHHSIRIFPPTNVKASVHFPQVIYPIGQNTLTLRLDGVARLNEKANTIEYWKLKKLTWRLEETTKSIVPACTRHAPRESSLALPHSSSNNVSFDDDESADSHSNHARNSTDAPAATATSSTLATLAGPVAAAAATTVSVAGPSSAAPNPVVKKKGVLRKEARSIGERTLMQGWKSHYGGVDDSMVEIELDYSLGKHVRYTCDTKSDFGTEVTHQLMVEMVMSQEWAPVGKPAMVTQTGVGRILRMHFTEALTERPGIGVSWDNEAPPIYQDVPPSPPSYSEEIRHGPLPENLEPLDAVEANP